MDEMTISKRGPGDCDHKWDGPKRYFIDGQKNVRGASATCSKCGIASTDCFLWLDDKEHECPDTRRDWFGQSNSIPNIYKTAVDKWGNDALILLAIAEFSELSAALARFWNHRGGHIEELRDKCIGELADAEIMCGQLRYMFGENETGQRKRASIARLRGMILKGTGSE